MEVLDLQIDTYGKFLQLKLDFLNCLREIEPNFKLENLIDVVFIKFNFSEIIEMIKKFKNNHDTVRFFLRKILISKNQLQNLDAHPIGLETSINFYSKNAQTILNVKHLQDKSTFKNKIKPNIDITIIHAGNHMAWFRLRIKNHLSILEKLKRSNLPHLNYALLTANILEIYFDQTTNESVIYNQMKLIFEMHSDVEEIIFYSNCRLVANEELLFSTAFSNLFKFYYCYLFQLDDTISFPQNYQDIFNLIVHCNILVQQKNFNTNKGELLQPISVLSGEKCIPTLKAQKGKPFYTGGPRDGLLLGLGTQVGGNSKSEIQLEINLN